MAWQVKVKYTNTAGVTHKVSDDVKNLFNQYVQDGNILSNTSEEINDKEKLQTLVFASEQKYTDYRNDLDTVIGGDATKFSDDDSVEIIEQKEVTWE